MRPPLICSRYSAALLRQYHSRQVRVVYGSVRTFLLCCDNVNSVEREQHQCGGKLVPQQPELMWTVQVSITREGRLQNWDIKAWLAVAKRTCIALFL